MNKATFGGGCFWCTEAIFQELKGVSLVESGYSGGFVDNPGYYDVCNGTTGHAEVIEVTYDSDIIPFKDIVKIHLTTHNPTTLNRQGADRGTQYRSIIFYRTDEEKKAIESMINETQFYYPDPIVTEIKAFEKFYEAELDHQDFYKSNPNKPYCQIVIDPKLAKLREMYSEKLK